MVLISRRAAVLGALAAAAAASPSRAALKPVLLRRGVNTFPWFQLTREYPAPSKDYAWPPFELDRPVPTSYDLHRLRAVGLDFLRIPVDPGPFLAAPPEQRRQLIAMLADAVKAALAADLTVVVNLQANAATHYWTPGRMTGATSAPEFAPYLDLVGEVATMLSRFPRDRIVLEPINEPGGACDANETADVRLALLARARKAAPELTLIASGGCGSLVQGLAAFDPEPLRSLEPLLFTFHFYEPYVFSHQGAPWMGEPMYRYLNGVSWPGPAGSFDSALAHTRQRMDADQTSPAAVKQAVYREIERVLRVYYDANPGRPFVDRYLRLAADWAKRHGVANEHLLMGEFGALRTDARYFGAAAPDRQRYVRDVRESAESYRFPWAFWNLFDGMGLMDDRSRSFDASMLEALGLDAALR
jgi:hypothetical protein